MGRSLLPVAGGILMDGCRDSVEWAGSIEAHDGVGVVSNPSEPFWDHIESHITRLWSVQNSSWEDPSRIHGGAGVVLMIDPQASRIHPVSTAGEIQTSFGNRG